MQKWQKVTQQQLRELARLRRLMAQETVRLESHVNEANASNDPAQQKARDAAMAELLRITQMHMKIMAQEQDLLRLLEAAEAKAAAEANEAVHKELSAEDWLLLESVIQKRQMQPSVYASAEMLGVDGGEHIKRDA